MQFLGKDEDISLNTQNPEQHPEFDDWAWVPPADVPGLAVSFKRKIYKTPLKEFGDLCWPTESSQAAP